MVYDILNPKCPTQQVLDRVASKWTMLVILALGEETLRYSELRARLPGVTQKMLTQTLRALERDGLVEREVFGDAPPLRTEYRITETGRGLANTIAVIRAWAYDNIDRIAQARSAYDRETDRH